jgi:hypothetical protein
MAAIPFIPGVPPFWIVLLNAISASPRWWRWDWCC